MNSDAVHVVGSKVWVLTAEDTWLKAQVTQLHDDGQEVTVKLEDGSEKRLPAAKCPLQNHGRPVEVSSTTAALRNWVSSNLCLRCVGLKRRGLGGVIGVGVAYKALGVDGAVSCRI
jgi:hypothetical protein